MLKIDIIFLKIDIIFKVQFMVNICHRRTGHSLDYRDEDANDFPGKVHNDPWSCLVHARFGIWPIAWCATNEAAGVDVARFGDELVDGSLSQVVRIRSRVINALCALTSARISAPKVSNPQSRPRCW